MGLKDLGYCFCSEGFPVLSMTTGKEIGIFKDKKRQRYGVGEHVLSFVMGDVYEFKILMFDKDSHKYKLGWCTSNTGTFWVTEDRIKKP